MTQIIALNLQHLTQLDLSPVQSVVEPWLENNEIASYEQVIHFHIDFPREATDPRELSEIAEVRLWFVRLDAFYPWFPFLVDWKSGQLARYAAMLVPHQFHRTEGIQYNPEALEIFVMHKIFSLSDWCKQQGIPAQFRLKSFAQLFGYDIDDGFFELI